MHNLLMALEVPLEHCNRVFLAVGYAPRYEATPLTFPGIEAVRDAITHLLHANNPAPAIVMDREWNVLAANVSAGVLFDLVGPDDAATNEFNLLETLLQLGGLGDHLINVEEIRLVAWQRAAREGLSNPKLAELLKSLPTPSGFSASTNEPPPLLLTRLNSRHGELTFMSTFTTFGMPLYVTMESLRIEHLIPADANTWEVMTQTHERAKAVLPEAGMAH